MQFAGRANGRRRMRSTFVAVACLLVGSIAVAYVVGLRAVRLSRNLAFQNDAIRHLEGFVSALKDAETGQRGYLLAGEEQYLEPYKAGVAEVRSKLEELRKLAASGQLSGNDVQRLE